MMDNHEYSSITSIQINPNNESVLVGTKDSKVRLVDSKTGKIFFEPAPYQWHNDEVNAVAFTPKGDFFASSSLDESINLGNATTGQRISTLLGHRESVNEIVYHPAGDKLFSVSADGFLNTWNLNYKQSESFNGCPDPGYGRGLFFAQVDPTGKKLAMACGKKIMIWDLSQKVNLELDAATYYGIDFLEDDRLAVGERDGNISIWEISTQKMIKRFAAHDQYIQKLICLDKRTVLTSSGKIMKVWDIENEKMIKSFEASSFVQSFSVSKKYNAIIASSSGGDNFLLDPKSLEVKARWKGSATGSVLVLSNDEEKFAIGQSDGGILVYETKSNRQLSELKDIDGPIQALSFDQSGNSLVSSTTMRSQTVKFWDLTTKTKSLSLHEFPDIASVQSTGDERRFVLIDKHGKVFLVRY
jgi:WD40 repeat protein